MQNDIEYFLGFVRPGWLKQRDYDCVIMSRQS